MEARAKLFGHPIHQMLIAFPVGLLATAVIFDVVHLVTDNAQWAILSFWMIGAGVVGGVAAAIFGLIDYRGIPRETRAKRVGRLHGIGNAIVLALYGTSWLMRHEVPQSPPDLALVLSFLGGGLAMVTAWLGGELVDRMGVGIDDGAHLNAPSSLSGKSTV